MNTGILVAQADEFQAVMLEDGFVAIFDGEDVIRVLMPYDVWETFTQDAINRRIL